MGRLNGGEVFARMLREQGVRHIFSLCGGHINPVFTGCLKEGVEIIDVRHEQVAAHAAAGWARTTGETGVAVVTAGPGVTDCVTGVAEAFTAGIPMLVFGGRAPRFDFDRGALQDMDQVRLMEPITKYARIIHDARRIPEYVANALRIARSPNPGPVYLECPIDILLEEIDEGEVETPGNISALPEGGGSSSQIREAIDVLLKAESPAVLAGDGVFWSGADSDLREFVELAGLPVRMTGLAQGAVPADHPLALGHAATAMADVVLSLGVKFDFLEGYGRTPLFNTEARFIQVGTDPEIIGYNRPADIGIVGNPGAVLRQMNEAISAAGKNPDRSGWIEQVRSVKETMEMESEPNYNSGATPIHPARLAREVVEFLDDDAIAIVDGGDCAGWFAPAFKPKFMGQLLATGPFGCLGVGMGLALAARLAHPKRQVLAYFGDGSFGLNAIEFDTFVRHRLPFVAVISNDGAWGMVRHWQRMTCGEEECKGMTLKPRQRYDRMVEALGGHGEYVDRIEEIKPALGRAFASGMPACVNVEVDPDAVSDTTRWLYQSLLGSGDA